MKQLAIGTEWCVKEKEFNEISFLFFPRQEVIFQPAVFISNIMYDKCTIKLNLDRCRCVDGSEICFHDKKKGTERRCLN